MAFGARSFTRDAVFAAAVAGAVIHLLQVQLFFASAWEFQAFHLGFALVLTFCSLAARSVTRSRSALLLLLAAAAAGCAAYVLIEYPSLISDRVFFPAPSDVTVAVLLVLLTLTATTLEWGFTLPVLATGAILYAYFGSYIPYDLFFHSGIELDRLTSYLAIPSFQGVLGPLTGLSATTVFLFMLFVGLLQATGGVQLILSLGAALAGRSRSSPALLSIFSSAFMGMLSGSTVANVASTGTMTIPLMKRSGFRAAEAGAIEAVASMGGQFTPPIMGLTAFLIVGITGIPYATIAVAAILPAIVFYAYLALVVHFRARCRKSRIDEGTPEDLGQELGVLPVRSALRRFGHLLFALAVLVYLLSIQEPPAMAASYAILVIVLAELAKGLAQSGGRRAGLVASLSTVLGGLRDGALLGAQLAIILATIGILTDIVVITGFAQKLSFLILDTAGGALWLLLFLSAVACLIFGLGLPTPAAYVLVALFGVPALLDAGTPLLHAHMFVFYFANMSAITPPVALAPLVASKIAGSGYFATSVAALRLGVPGFVLPFLFAYYPDLLMQGELRVTSFALALSALAAVVLLNASATGNFYWPLARWERCLLFAGAFGFLGMDWRLALSGAVVFGLVLAHRTLQAHSPERLEPGITDKWNP